MNFETFDNEDNATKYLYFFTNHYYVFTQGLDRCWNELSTIEHTTKDQPFYQLMPADEDDGFFDWYRNERLYNQLFKTKEMCVLHFIIHWTEWSRSGKPNYEGF